MNNNEEQFELTPIIEEPMNEYKIIHLYNKNNTYHLTRQILLNSAYTMDTYCLFYHILAKNMDDFNDEYGSIACLIPRNQDEADLYMNVDTESLEIIIKYIQTNKMTILEKKITTLENNKLISEIIDLATIFAMPKLVALLRNN